jgi:hypothetical protein
MKLQAQLTGQLQAEQNAFAMEMAQMELEAAKQQGQGQLFGSMIGGVASLAMASI